MIMEKKVAKQKIKISEKRANYGIFNLPELPI